MKNQTHEEFIKEHFDTGLKLEKEWRFSTFPDGDKMNSRSQIQLEKGKFKDKLIGVIPKTTIRMNELDGRLGGGYNIFVKRQTRYGLDSFDFHLKKYDEVIDQIHSLMRMLK